MWKCSDTTFFLRLKHLKSTSIFLGPYLLNYFGYSLMESRWGINVYFTNLYKHLLFSIFSCISIIVSTFKLCLLWKNTNVRASMKNCIMWKLLKKKKYLCASYRLQIHTSLGQVRWSMLKYVTPWKHVKLVHFFHPSNLFVS